MSIIRPNQTREALANTLGFCQVIRGALPYIDKSIHRELLENVECLESEVSGVLDVLDSYEDN